VFFPEYERNLALELVQRIGSDATTSANMSSFQSQLEQVQNENPILFDADAYFAEAMQSKDVVLGFSFRSNEGVRKGVLPKPIFTVDESDNEAISLAEAQGFTGNVDTLQNSASGGGFFDTTPDVDGIIRSYIMIQQYRNRIYPSLALDMARLYNFEENFSAVIEGDSGGNFRELVGISMGNTVIPTNPNGEVRIPYIGAQGSFPYISATDVMNDTLTPVQAVYPGVEIQANVLNAILSSAPLTTIDAEASKDESALGNMMSVLDEAKNTPFPSRPDWVQGAVFAAITVIGAGLAVIYPYLGPALLAISSITFMIGMTAMNFYLWSRYNLDFPLVLLILLIAVVNMTYGFLKEGLNKKLIKGMFDQYVPPAHIDAMLNDPDKYVGDMGMAFWGAPLDDPNHRSNAITAALTMLKKVEELKPVFKAQGLPEVNIGIGINSGMMNVPCCLRVVPTPAVGPGRSRIPAIA
jgi:adenylate cyclase